MATPISTITQPTTTYNTYTSGVSAVGEDEDTGIGGEAVNSNYGREITNESQALGKDEFLQLLIAEMTYQDPLDPMSNTESISQMANFSSLEQMQNLNDSFDTLALNLEGSSLSSGAQLIGKTANGYTSVTNNDGTSEELRFEGEVIGVSLRTGETYYSVLDEETNSLLEVSESEIISVEKRETESTSTDQSTTVDDSTTDSTTDSSTDVSDDSTVEKDVVTEDQSTDDDEPA